ncbi:MAG: hypothetical protein R3321_02000, partial [Nitrososphaeraceae archaeon]|nr:hypothetical protein [Nitrososphaeraceae archaeon]
GYGITPFDSSAFNLDITNIKLEYGQEATPLKYDRFTDLHHCQYFFQKSLPIDTPLGSTNNLGEFGIDVNGDNTAICIIGSYPKTEHRYIHNADINLGGAPSASRIRAWSRTSTTIDQTTAQIDQGSRTITNYNARPNGFFVTVSGVQSTYHQMHWAADFDFWFN